MNRLYVLSILGLVVGFIGVVLGFVALFNGRGLETPTFFVVLGHAAVAASSWLDEQ